MESLIKLFGLLVIVGTFNIVAKDLKVLNSINVAQAAQAKITVEKINSYPAIEFVDQSEMDMN